MHLAVTSARLELGAAASREPCWWLKTRRICLRAQRQLAWKEVAQRVAHEIKNPLTPIALSAERIGRHLDRGQPDSPNMIRKCSEVILGCVGTLRTLVDQFSALAQFPAPQPRACDMNQVADEALALFAGRLEGITVQARPGAGPAAGAGRSRGHPPRPGQPHRQRRRSHAGQPAARTRACAPRSAKTAPRSRSSSPTPGTASPTKSASACFCPSTPPSTAAPAWGFPSPPRSCRSTAARSAPNPTAPRARASCCAFR